MPQKGDVLAAAGLEGIPPEVAEAYWLSRERVSWQLRGMARVMNQREWRADLRSFWAAWQRNEKKEARPAGLKEKLELLREEERNHPANERGKAYGGNPSHEELEDLGRLQGEIAELKRKIMGE
jgi:hypothetical protein